MRTKINTLAIAALLLSTMLVISHDAQCEPSPDAVADAAGVGLDENGLPPAQPPASDAQGAEPGGDKFVEEQQAVAENTEHGTKMDPKEKKDDEESEDSEKELGESLSETEGWKGEGEDKFFGKEGEYLTHKVGDKEMLFHSNDGGKTYYPVNDAAQSGYKVSDGSLSLPKDFNSEAPGSVMRESAGIPGPGGGEGGILSNSAPGQSTSGVAGGGTWNSPEVRNKLDSKYVAKYDQMMRNPNEDTMRSFLKQGPYSETGREAAAYNRFIDTRSPQQLSNLVESFAKGNGPYPNCPSCDLGSRGLHKNP